MTEREISYLAGIVDGEGCITINYNRKRDTYAARISVSTTDKILADWLIEKVGGYVYLRKKQKPHHREKWEWCLYTNTPQRYILEALKTEVLIKKKQIDLALQFLDLSKQRGVKDKRAFLKDLIKIANARGVTTEREAPLLDEATV